MQTVTNWQIGCSGFHYKEWKELFYPAGLPQRSWFTHYCEHFSALELNVTFYRFPQLTTLQGWYEKSPAHFSFAVKAPRLITHYKKFEETASLLNDFYNVTRQGLKEKLGCILFQLPPDLSFSEQLLDKIINQLDGSFKNIIEFRHKSWWNSAVYDVLTMKNISFCSISYPNLPDPVIQTTGTVYYRFHGVPRLYHSAYSESFLQKIADEINNLNVVEQAFLFFNNTASTAAIHNARYLQQQLLQNH